MPMPDVAWIALRIVYAWMFLYPAIGLLRDWPTTVRTTALLFAWKPAWFAALSVATMIVGALSIAIGFHGRIGAAALAPFCLGGAVVHYRLAGLARASQLSAGASADDFAQHASLRGLAVVGHVTSAEKNFVLAAVAFFIALVGTGPFSLADSGPLL